MSWAPIDGPSPPLARSTHWRPHRPKWSIVEGDTRTGWSQPRRGRSSVVARSAHHCAGSAPGTCSRESQRQGLHGVGPGAGVGVEEGAAQLGDESLQGQRARDVGEDTVVGAGVDDVEVGRRLLVLAADGRDDEATAGAGARDVEQSGLVVADLGTGGPWLAGAAGDDVDEVGGPEQGAAQPEVGPDALLHPGDDDEVPLEAGGTGGVSRATDSPVAARAARVSPATSCESTWSRKSAGRDAGAGR